VPFLFGRDPPRTNSSVCRSGKSGGTPPCATVTPLSCPSAMTVRPRRNAAERKLPVCSSHERCGTSKLPQRAPRHADYAAFKPGLASWYSAASRYPLSEFGGRICRQEPEAVTERAAPLSLERLVDDAPVGARMFHFSRFELLTSSATTSPTPLAGRFAASRSRSTPELVSHKLDYRQGITSRPTSSAKIHRKDRERQL